MSKTNNPHPVTVILRDWSKAKKGNAPVAEKKEVYHDKNRKDHSSNSQL